MAGLLHPLRPIQAFKVGIMPRVLPLVGAVSTQVFRQSARFRAGILQYVQTMRQQAVQAPDVDLLWPQYCRENGVLATHTAAALRLCPSSTNISRNFNNPVSGATKSWSAGLDSQERPELFLA